MRLYHALLLFPLLGTPVLAQSDAPPAAEHHRRQSAAEHHGRQSAAEHFAAANTTHDGHLTLDQATSGYKSIAKSFSQIDVSHHGYVTMDDIKAWRAAKKAAHTAARKATADAADTAAGIIRPMPASQRWPGLRPTNASTDLLVPSPSERPRLGVDLPKARLDGDQSS